MSTPCGLACELDTVEVDEIEDITNFDFVKIYSDRIGSMLRSDAVDNDMLGTMMNGKLIDEKTVLTIKDVRWLYAPFAVI